jgi:hypothetical protein
VIEPDGSTNLLASGFVLYMDLTVAARNLEKRGIVNRLSENGFKLKT